MIKLSRIKIDLFVECPRCFYLDMVKKIKRPQVTPLNLNNAVDTLLKREFDIHRAAGTKHPLQIQFGIDAFPSNHPQMNAWRQSMTAGVIHIDTEKEFHLHGGIDDLWEDRNGVYYVVDYKATSKNEPVVKLEFWMKGFKRQVEIYQWLLRKNGLNVSDTAYFVYCNGDRTAEAFDNCIRFYCHIIPYKGNDKWIDSTLDKIYQCLHSSKIPEPGANCDYCNYALAYSQNIVNN